MGIISMKQLLESGVHFGHQTKRWNPKMAPYIFTQRNGIYIIDLQKTVKYMNEAYNFIVDTVSKGGEILFVGTKKQASEAIKEEAIRCGMHYVNARWLGGTLTNFKTIRGRIGRLEKLHQMSEDGTFDLLPKKEVMKLTLEMEKLEKYLGGIKDMNKLPAALFIIDPTKEAIAIAEARKLNIPIISVVDTNCNPDVIDYVIPGNDDAIRAVKLSVSVMANAVIEAKNGSDGEHLENSEDYDYENPIEEVTGSKDSENNENNKEDGIKEKAEDKTNEEEKEVKKEVKSKAKKAKEENGEVKEEKPKRSRKTTKKEEVKEEKE